MVAKLVRAWAHNPSSHRPSRSRARARITSANRKRRAMPWVGVEGTTPSARRGGCGRRRDALRSQGTAAPPRPERPCTVAKLGRAWAAQPLEPPWLSRTLSARDLENRVRLPFGGVFLARRRIGKRPGGRVPVSVPSGSLVRDRIGSTDLPARQSAPRPLSPRPLSPWPAPTLPLHRLRPPSPAWRGTRWRSQ